MVVFAFWNESRSAFERHSDEYWRGSDHELHTCMVESEFTRIRAVCAFGVLIVGIVLPQLFWWSFFPAAVMLAVANIVLWRWPSWKWPAMQAVSSQRLMVWAEWVSVVSMIGTCVVLGGQIDAAPVPLLALIIANSVRFGRSGRTQSVWLAATIVTLSYLSVWLVHEELDIRYAISWILI